MKIIGNTVLIALSGLLFNSCDLDLVPSTAIVQDAAFQTIEDATRFENGIARQFRGSQHNVFSFTAEVQTDMFNATTTFGNRNGAVHQNNANFTTGEYNTRDVWRQCYKTIVAANNLLDNIDKITAKDATEENTLKVLKGRAYFYRAATYHYMVQHFSKDYEPSSASTDLGLPLLTTYDLAARPARATVAQTYELIEADIAEAKALLAGVAGAVRSTVPTIDAVIALDARVQLCKHNYSGAASLANQLITGGKYTLADTPALMTAAWVNDNGPEDIFQMFASLSEFGLALIGSGSASTRMANNIYLMYNNTMGRYAPDFIPTKTCVDRYETGDLRKEAWFPVLPTTIGSTEVDIHLFNKYSGNPALFTPPTRTYSHKPKIFTIAEMYLIRAEALLASGDAPGARTALNTLQTARGATPTEATETTIRTEWAKETIGEGVRLACLKRWHIGYSRGEVQDLNIVMVGQNFNQKTATADDFRFNWPVPSGEMSVNPNLVQNPGW